MSGSLVGADSMSALLAQGRVDMESTRTDLLSVPRPITPSSFFAALGMTASHGLDVGSSVTRGQPGVRYDGLGYS